MHTFSGQLGSTVGYLKYGENFERMLGGSKSPRNPRTEKQSAVRLKFQILNRFAQKLSGILKITMKSSVMPSTSVFFKRNYDDIFGGNYPTFSLLYDKAILSTGGLDNPYSPNAVVESNVITVSWTDNSGIGLAKKTDDAIIVAYNSVKEQAIFTAEGGERSTRQATLTLPSAWSGDSIDVWFAMRSKEGVLSESMYLGNFSI